MLAETNRGQVLDGTLTRDIADSVAVTDFVRHKTIMLHADQSYLAKAIHPAQIADAATRRPNEAATGAVATSSPIRASAKSSRPREPGPSSEATYGAPPSSFPFPGGHRNDGLMHSAARSMP